MGFLFDDMFKDAFKVDTTVDNKKTYSTVNTSSQSSQDSYQYDYSYAPIFNISSPNSSIAPVTKKEASVSQAVSQTPTVTPSQSFGATGQMGSAGSDKGISGLLSDNLSGIIVLAGLGTFAYFYFKKK